MIPKELICKICNKKYHSIQSLCNHNKKFHSKNNGYIIPTNIPIVIPIIEPKNEGNKKCKLCNKILSSYKNKWRHETQYCKNRITNNLLNKETSNLLNKETPNLLTKETPNLLKKETIINNINNNIIKNTNKGTINNIVINNYSNDNIDYISDNFIKRMFDHLKNDKEHHIPISKVIENIKFNPHHKENNNVKITNMRSKVGMKYNNNKWLTVDKNELLNELYDLGNDMLKKWSEKEGFLTDEMKIYYERFNKISRLVLTSDIMEELNKKAYIYTKNNDTTLDT